MAVTGVAVKALRRLELPVAIEEFEVSKSATPRVWNDYTDANKPR